MESEIIKLLKSPEAKSFGALVGIAIVVGVGAMVWRNYLQTKVLYQQTKINKYVLKKYRAEFTPAEQKIIEEKVENFS